MIARRVVVITGATDGPWLSDADRTTLSTCDTVVLLPPPSRRSPPTARSSHLSADADRHLLPSSASGLTGSVCLCYVAGTARYAPRRLSEGPFDLG